MAAGYSGLDMISSFLFSLEMNSKIVHTWLLCSYMLLFFSRTTFFGEWFNIYNFFYAKNNGLLYAEQYW